MKKKSLLFLSLCAWTLQSHLVHANTLAETSNQVSQGTESESQSSNSNTAAVSSNGVATTVAPTGTVQSKNVVSDTGSEDTTTIASSQTESSTSASVPASSIKPTTNAVASSVTKTTSSTNTVASTTQARSASISTPVSQASNTNSVATASTTVAPSVATNNSTTASSTSVASSVATNNSTTASTQSNSSTVSDTTPNLVSVSNIDSQKGTYDVRITNVSSSKEIKTVFVPTWTEVNGQDDIVWYEAKRQLDNSYRLTVNKAQHNNITGTYHSHVYYLAKDGSLTGVGTTSATLQAPKPTGTVSVANVNTQTGTYDVVVKNVYSPTSIDKVLIPTWTSNKGQDDIVWHEASRQADGSYKYTVKKTEHKNETGTYISHVYYRGKDGKQTYIGATTADLSSSSSQSNTSNKLSGTITISNINAENGSFVVKITNVSSPNGVKSVSVPTWTENKSVDDIVFHEAVRQPDGSYEAVIKKSEHKNEIGKYITTVYYHGNDGSRTFVGTKTATLPAAQTVVKTPEKASGKVTVSNINANTGTYDVVISDVKSPVTIDKVLVPTWTSNKGQDDIIWHEASRQADGSYKYTVKKTEHKNETGAYISHVYYQGTDGKRTFIGSTTANIPAAPAQSTISDKLSGTITVSNINAENGSFVVKITNVASPNGVKSVIVPTWTENKSVDDIVFHEAVRQSDGSYEVTIKKSEHKNETGKYITTVYYQGENGTRTFVGTTNVTLPASQTVEKNSEIASGKVTVSNVNSNSGTYDVVISEVKSPVAIDKVLVPTWTENKGQDDIIWHEASRQPDGTYKYTVKKFEHNNEIGKYVSHVYYRGTDGSMTGVGAVTTELQGSTTPAKASGTISVTNVNSQTGSFDVVIKDVYSPVSLDKVLVPTWTDNKDQDDIIWHEASRQADGSYRLTVLSSQHKNESGRYTSHVYYRGKDGSMAMVGATSANLPAGAYSQRSPQRSYTVYIDPGHGGADSGASYGGVHEKNLAMNVANKLKANLLALGINVLMTRTGDYNVDYVTERSRMVNSSNADLFISLHFNATGAGTTTTRGIETYWYQSNPSYPSKINQAYHNDPTRLAESQTLANQIQSSLIKETGAYNRGVKRETFAVLRETKIPAVLVEMGFMDNPSELQVIKQDSYQTKLAKALAEGIVNWYGAVGGK